MSAFLLTVRLHRQGAFIGVCPAEKRMPHLKGSAMSHDYRRLSPLLRGVFAIAAAVATLSLAVFIDELARFYANGESQIAQVDVTRA
jgi:hypothetical protein